MKIFKGMLLLIAAVLLLSACQGRVSVATPTSTRPASTPTVQPSETPTQIDPQDLENSYENPLYGFAFTYSGLWLLEEIPAAASGQNNMLRLKMESVELDIEYGFQFEFNGIQLPDMPLGELVEEEPVVFLEQSLPQTALVEDERTKMLLFPAPSELFLVDDLFFRVTLQETAALAQNEIVLPPSTIDEALAVLTSFARIERTAAPADPYPGWETFINLDYGFLLRYPPDWEVERRQVEISPTVFEDAVLLTKENSTLMLAYHFSVNFLPRTVGFPGGLLVDEGTVTFLGQQIQKLTLVYAEKEKGVYYNGLEPLQAEDLTFHLSLQDHRAGIGYDRLEVPDAVQQEAESILPTVRRFPAVLAPTAAGVKSEGKEYFLTFGSGFDLDEGMQMSGSELGVDFTIAKSGSLNIEFQPLAPAAFGFDGVLAQQPMVSQCANLQGMRSSEETIAPLDAYYVCFQTNAGRYGWLIFRALTSDGVTFDWQTFSTSGPLVQADGENAAITLRDITVPDGTVFEPGESFEKTWQLMNTGKTAWTTDYAIRFKEGERLGAPFEVAMPKVVPPGGSVNLTVQMTAPQQPGEYVSHWVLRDAAGRPFGVGRNGDETFWAQIVVEDKTAAEEEEEEPQGEDKLVVETSITVNPSDFSGTCPAALALRFSITTEGTDHYTYEMVAGATETTFEFYMPEPSEVVLGSSERNTKTVEYTLTMQNSVQGWLQLLVTDPGEYRSGKVYFTVNCE